MAQYSLDFAFTLSRWKHEKENIQLCKGQHCLGPGKIDSLQKVFLSKRFKCWSPQKVVLEPTLEQWQNLRKLTTLNSFKLAGTISLVVYQ